VLFDCQEARPEEDCHCLTAPTRSGFFVVLAAITGLALALRLFHLGLYPAGLFFDEATEGLDALSLAGKPIWHWPLFFTAINGREPLFVYLVHVAQLIWGPTIWSVRVVAALAGVLLVPAMAWLAWEMAPDLVVHCRNRFALWAALAVPALLWSQTISRLAQRMSLFVLFEALFCAALWHAWRSSGRLWWAAAGVLAGLSFYTYLAVRLVPLALGMCLVLAWLRQRPALRARRQGLAIMSILALLVAAPLLAHFVQNPSHFVMRSGQVDILEAGGAPALANNVLQVLGMAFVRGDLNARLNFPNRPVLDWLTLIPFVLGLALSLRWFWRPARFFLLAMLGAMLLPTVLSVEAPNFGRSIGALPIFALLIALGLDRMLAWLGSYRPWLLRIGAGAGWAALLMSVGITGQVYFVRYAALPDLFAAWDTGYTQVAQDMASVPPAGNGGPERIYAGPGVVGNPTVQYLLSGKTEAQHPHDMDGRSCVRIDTSGPARYYVIAAVDGRGERMLASYLPDSRETTVVADPAGRPWAVAFEQPRGGRIVFPELLPRPATFGSGIQLMGYWLSQRTVRAGDRLYVRLFWRASSVPKESYTTFVHLDREDAGLAPPVAGVDALPGNGACVTNDWQPGEVIVDELQLVVPSGAPDGKLTVTTGLYRRETMQRLHIAGNPDDQLTLSIIEKVG
jgi:4-amino-4-deoxy-L-arabinose transferase-like glycosyltransferase